MACPGLTPMWTTCVEAPITERENENIRYPERDRGAQQLERLLLPRWKRGDEKRQRQYEPQCHHGAQQVAQNAVHPMAAETVSDDRRSEKNHNENGEQPP